MEAIFNHWIFQNILNPALDVMILAFLIYKGYQILIQTKAIQLAKGAFFIALVYLAAFSIRLGTILWLMNTLLPAMAIIIAIVFQQELRSIFLRLGQGNWFSNSSKKESFSMDRVISAVSGLSDIKRGALIVFARNVGLKSVIESGTALDAELSSALLLTIFSFDTALHDGAVIVIGDRIAAAGCFLPLSEQKDIRRSFGTRHRAALGIAEESDAVCLIVSEETGAISLAYDSNLHYDLDRSELRQRLSELFEASKAPQDAEETDE
jgi:diadenylate cyclase